MTGRAQSAGTARTRVILASVVGTTIEFYDFYIYGTAAALVLGPVFFPAADPAAQALNAFLTFGIAFLARPVGAMIFGHFGDRVGRKSTLVASMLVMGLSTTLIGALPGYASAGTLAPVLLCLLRLGQGLGLGGEWGGAALLTVENAPPGQRAWYGMFPQLGPALGFILANGLFLALTLGLGEADFSGWAWRIPFLASAVLVVIGLAIRLGLEETPAFLAVRRRGEAERVPLMAVLRHHGGPLLQGSLAMVVCYALFYIATVFALSYMTGTRHMARAEALGLLIIAILAMALCIPVSAALADRFGRRPVLIAASLCAALTGLATEPLLGGESTAGVLLFLALALGVMGLTFGPMGALLPELFPTRLRYTGCSTAYNLGGILGASLAPYLAQKLFAAGGLPWVGLYVTAAAIVSGVSLLTIRETATHALGDEPATSPAVPMP